MNNNLTISIISLVGLIFAKTWKIYSENVVNKFSDSDRWPLDDWKMALMGLGYMMRLSLVEALKKAKSSVVMADILFWCFLCASVFFGLMWEI
jgi:uncharacterized membrane protein YadS